MIYDCIIVGAGPGGSSAATFLARQGISTLLLDKEVFPRDKVCGDGLAPQALYWIDELGCINEVLDQTDSCITTGDIFINGEHLSTGRFPQDAQYPGFCTLLERKRLDFILAKNAVKNGAVFKPGHMVKEIDLTGKYIVARAESDGKMAEFQGMLLIGADGVNSVVARSIGNILKEGTSAVSVRGYYEGVDTGRSQIQIYFNEQFFPGYGWVFTDDSGKANIGIGYAIDRNFPKKRNLQHVFEEFIRKDLKGLLKNARPDGNTAGWWASFFRPKSMVAERVMLIGDAANVADPINGGGIHKAMESAFISSQVAAYALSSGDFSVETLRTYEMLWKEHAGFDWRIGEFLLTIAKNPDLRELYLFLLKNIANLTKGNVHLQEFCSGVFLGMIPLKDAISPIALLNAIPLKPCDWVSMLYSSGRGGSLGLYDAFSAGANIVKMAGRIAVNTISHLNWGAEVLKKSIGLGGLYMDALTYQSAIGCIQ